jgi:hypothetical protein
MPMAPVSLFALCLLLALGSVVRAEEPLLVATPSVEFGEDLGQNFGTLFEVRDDSGRAIIGAGFPGIYNTGMRLDRFALQFYVRPPGDVTPAKELLPRSNAGAHQSVQDGDGRLFAWTYSGDRTVRTWEGGEWRDDPTLDPQRAAFGDGFMRVGDGLLVWQGGQASYDGQLVLPRATEGTYQCLYYAHGHLCFYHTKTGDGGFTRISAAPWRPGQAQADLTQTRSVALRKVGETPFVWGQLNGEVLTVSNWGTTAVFDGAEWRVLRWPVENTSYQVYSAVNYHDALLLGHYPTGNLLRFDGSEVRQWEGRPPVMPGVATYSREAQSTMLYRGDLYVGVWPWAELWRYDRDRDEWTLVDRPFTTPAPTAAAGHPFEAEITRYNEDHGTKVVMNLWGQRICGLAPWRDSLMVATSAKGPMERDPNLAFLTDEVYAQYGRIWRYTLPGHLSAPVRYTPAATRLTCELLPDRLRVLQDGTLRGEATLDPRLLEGLKPAAITWGRGLYGATTCRLQEREVTPPLLEAEAPTSVADPR